LRLCLDTSVLVAALTREVATERARRFLAAADPEGLAVSAWAITEFSSALSIKVRSGQLDADLRNRVSAAFFQMLGASFEVLPVSVAAFTAAAGFAGQHAIGLRAGDALHLAVAAEHGAVLVSLDRRLVEAGSALGIATRLL
jgi:predicted nucleic acid-binding protein